MRDLEDSRSGALECLCKCIYNTRGLHGGLSNAALRDHPRRRDALCSVCILNDCKPWFWIPSRRFIVLVRSVRNVIHFGIRDVHGGRGEPSSHDIGVTKVVSMLILREATYFLPQVTMGHLKISTVPDN